MIEGIATAFPMQSLGDHSPDSSLKRENRNEGGDSADNNRLVGRLTALIAVRILHRTCRQKPLWSVDLWNPGEHLP